MKKHKARRRQRQARQTAQPVRFNPRNHHQCMSESCRRARKCLGRAMICGCTIHFEAVGTESDAEKLRSIRKCLERVLAEHDRLEALGLGEPPHPVFDNPNATEEEKMQVIRAEMEARLGKLE